jgi:catechol 2,3-dioxygenase-like lactoylglutathione lyase family enzyme
MSIRGFDHCAITVSDIERTIAFYRDVLRCEVFWEKEWREGKMPAVSLRVGANRINVHPAAKPIAPHAQTPLPGSADLCFRWDGGIESAVELMRRSGIEIEVGPVPRVAADGAAGQSIYFRDPDGNLLELLASAS